MALQPLLSTPLPSHMPADEFHTARPGRRMAAPAAALTAAMALLGCVALFGAEADITTGSLQLASAECSTTYPESDKMCNYKSSPVLEGVDVVAYFSLPWAQDMTAEFGSQISSGAAIMGSAEYSATYAGYSFYFASDANRALFAAAPEVYAPTFGGFCAYGVSGYDGRDNLQRQTQLYSVPSSPEVWAIVDGALYFARGTEALELFLVNATRNIAGGGRPGRTGSVPALGTTIPPALNSTKWGKSGLD